MWLVSDIRLQSFAWPSVVLARGARGSQGRSLFPRSGFAGRPRFVLEVRMRRLVSTVALALAGAAVSACAPHPIVARDPVPAPSSAESYVCDSRRLPLNGAWSNCEQRYREPRTVLQSRG